MIPSKTLDEMDSASLLREYESRRALLRDPSIVLDELQQLVDKSIELYGYHPNWFREKGLV